MTKVIRKIRDLSTLTKIEIVVALILTIVMCAAIPVYAWFTNQKKIAELAKIKAPDELYINAAHKEDIINLDMTSVDVTKKYTTTDNGVLTEHDITSQSFVFSVSGEWVNSYTLQIEHTTNNPFKYTICEGEIYKSIAEMKVKHSDCEDRNDDGSLKYIEYRATNVYDTAEMQKITNWGDDGLTIETGQLYYVWIGAEVKNKNNQTGRYLNQTGSGTDNRYANDIYLDKSYESGTKYQKYAKPLFWQLKNIKASDTKAPFYNTYVIKIDWTGVSNITDYKKETDIFYISAFVE